MDVNDNRHRYHLIKAQTVAEIEQHSGAMLVVRGKYYPDRKLATEKDPPLHIEVSGTCQEFVDKAVEKLEQIKTSGPPVPKAPTLVTEKVFMPFETDSFPGFNFRNKILGPQVKASVYREIFVCRDRFCDIFRMRVEQRHC